MKPFLSSAVCRALLALAGVASLVAGHGAAAAPGGWSDDFRRGLDDWGRPHAWGQDNHSFLPDALVRGKLFRVAIHQGGIDPATMRARGLPVSGTGFKARLIPDGAERATLSYKLRFPADFEFKRGGKLPGLYGGSGNSGGKIPDGRDGFSFRLMWLEKGKGRVYAYVPASVNYGTPLLEGKFQFVPGQWHRITEELVLNTEGNRDGAVKLWVDGSLVGEETGLLIRTSSQLKIDGVFFDVFYGGNDDTWAAPKATHVDFAEFELSWR